MRNALSTETQHQPVVEVLAADDQDAFLSVVGELVRLTPGFTLSAVARSGEEALARVASQPPNIVLMDARMPGIGGIEAARAIARDHGDIVVVLISIDDVDGLPASACSCGAAAVVNKVDLRPALLRQLWSDHQPG
jgi:two-component system, NarL family, invasion response regulator UvrY